MREIYAWVPWFQELAEKIATGGKEYLSEGANQVEWGREDAALLQYGDRNIDPFSFFYFLAQKSRPRLRPKVYPSVGDKFEIKSPLPSTNTGIYYTFPTPSNPSVLFHDTQTFYPDLLWNLFKQVVESEIDPDDFKRVLNIRNVGVKKLTQTLFLINPKYFLPVDDSTGAISEFLLDLTPRETRRKIKNDGWGQYLSVLEKFKERFPGCWPYEINMYLQSSHKQNETIQNFF